MSEPQALLIVKGNLKNVVMREELWVIHGNEPVLWTIPFWVNYEDGASSALIYHAIALLNRHLDAVRKLLEPVATPEKGMWRIERIALDRIGKKVEMAEGVDMGLLFTWERIKTHQMAAAPERENRKDIDEFLDAIYQSGLPVSRDGLALIYHQICLHALDWMVNKERPLDLYFVKLHNCPYRSNWKHVLLTRFPRLGRRLSFAGHSKRETIAIEAGLDEELRSLDLLAMQDRGTFIQRHIEAEPMPLWYKQTWKVELARLKLLGAIKYAKAVMDSVARWSKSALRIYSSWLGTLARQSALDVECGKNGQYRLVPNLPGPQLLDLPRPAYPVPVVVPNRCPGVKGASLAKDLYPKDGILPEELPAVQPPPADVWYTRPDLRRSGEPKRKKPWVLLFPSSEKRHPMQLLGQEHGPTNGMAKRVEQFPEPNPDEPVAS